LSYLANRQTNLQTDRQTNKQTKTGKNITSMAEVIMTLGEWLVLMYDANVTGT